jgi:putative nucleotidyltransferase with HDIG domain
MTGKARTLLLKRLEALDQMPSIPVVLGPLLRCLEQPLEQIDVKEVVDLVSQDKSLAAQCLHMANSPLFGRWGNAGTLRSAVIALGIHRMRDIALSCSVLKLIPNEQSLFDPIVFWEHSLACALIARKLGREIGFANPEKAYLCGLLHDIGIIVNLWIAPHEFGGAIELARLQGIPLHEAEAKILGVTHAESGRVLAEHWNFTADLVEVIACHHQVGEGRDHKALLGLVSLSDILCRMEAMGHGYTENRQVNLQEEPGFTLLINECSSLQNFDWARLTFELEGYVDEVKQLVSQLYRPQ